MTRTAIALRFAALAVALLWWLPTVIMMFGHLAWRKMRMWVGLV